MGVWDGAWIIFLSEWGVVGLITRFSLVLLPIFMVRRRLRKFAKPHQLRLAGLSVILGITGIDLLPNGFFSALPMFLAGAVAGLAQGMPSHRSGAGAQGPSRYPSRWKRPRAWVFPVHHWSLAGGRLPWSRVAV